MAKKTIMWLEDDAYFVRKLMRSYQDEGFEVRIYETASLFLADLSLVQESALLVIDLLVPSGPDVPDQNYAGLEVVRRVSGLAMVPPILVFSVVFRPDVESQISRYTSNFLQKPVRIGDFKRKIDSLLGRGGTDDSK